MTSNSTTNFHTLTFIIILVPGLLISGCASSVETPTTNPTENVFSDLVITMERPLALELAQFTNLRLKETELLFMKDKIS